MDNVKPTKACEVYSYDCIMMQVSHFPIHCYIADILQVFSGHQPYHGLRTKIAVIDAKMRGGRTVLPVRRHPAGRTTTSVKGNRTVPVG